MSGNNVFNDLLQQKMYMQMGMDPNTATLLAMSDNEKGDSQATLMTMMALNGGMSFDNSQHRTDHHRHSREHLASRGREIFGAAYSNPPMQQQYMPQQPMPRQQQYMPQQPMPMQQQYMPQQPMPMQQQYMPQQPIPMQQQYMSQQQIPMQQQPVFFTPQFTQQASAPPQTSQQPAIVTPRATVCRYL